MGLRKPDDNAGIFSVEGTVLVVASDSKNVSDYTTETGRVYVCDGTADDVQINAALSVLP